MGRTVALVLFLPLVLSLGTPEGQTWTGRVSAVGHDPFTYLALTEASGRQWRLRGDPVKPLWKQAQLRRITVTGHAEGVDAIVVTSWAWAPEEKP